MKLKLMQLCLLVLFVGVCMYKIPVYAANSIPAKSIMMKAPLPTPIVESKDQKNIAKLFDKRPIGGINIFNFIYYGVRSSVAAGVPVNSLMLILSIPIIATLVVFLRYIVGFPTLGIAPTIAFALTFFITGIIFGSILFVTLLLATIVSRVLFKRIRIMQLTKVSLSLLVTSILTIIAIVLSLHYGFIASSQISIFPILLFILLTERVAALQLEKDMLYALGITLLTLILGAASFFVISTSFVTTLLLVYPETLLLLIPINWFIGKYFGLRLTEYSRFVPNIHYGNK